MCCSSICYIDSSTLSVYTYTTYINFYLKSAFEKLLYLLINFDYDLTIFKGLFVLTLCFHLSYIIISFFFSHLSGDIDYNFETNRFILSLSFMKGTNLYVVLPFPEFKSIYYDFVPMWQITILPINHLKLCCMTSISIFMSNNSLINELSMSYARWWLTTLNISQSIYSRTIG